MNPDVRAHLDNIRSNDRAVQGAAYQTLIADTRESVDWAYEAWDELVRDLASTDNRLRSIASQLLANLAAKSDPRNRIAKDFDTLLNVTRDEKFVTARHALQAIWKVGLAGSKQKKTLLKGLALRFTECAPEKNSSLIRYDIIECLRNLYDASHDEKIRRIAFDWIESEPDAKYRKKYAGLFSRGTSAAQPVQVAAIAL